MHKVELGDECRDKVTGFTGIAIARTQWIHGCDRITLQPQMGKKGEKKPDNDTFDELGIEVVKKSKVKPHPRNDYQEPEKKYGYRTGGWQDDKAALRR